MGFAGLCKTDYLNRLVRSRIQMTEFNRVTTGLGEECGVFGAYDMDGNDVAPSIYYGLFASTEGRRAAGSQ